MKIFLSHASEAKPLVRRLTAALPPHVERWLDQDELSTGEKFGKHIEAGIRNECDFLLVFIDEDALASEWVKREVALGLQRHRDLQRPFVLPVLIADVPDRMHEIGLPADEWLYLDARDHSDEGLAASAARLQAELFKHASELVERLRNTDRRALIDAFAAELAEYEQVAFRWVASMRNGYKVLIAVETSVDHVQDCLTKYNLVADRVIPRLQVHRDRLCSAWRDSRSLCRHLADFIDFVEDGVYRGAMYRLNAVLQMLHDLMVADAQQRLVPSHLLESDAKRVALLDQAQAALDRMTQDASELFGDFTSELD